MGLGPKACAAQEKQVPLELVANKVHNDYDVQSHSCLTLVVRLCPGHVLDRSNGKAFAVLDHRNLLLFRFRSGPYTSSRLYHPDLAFCKLQHPSIRSTTMWHNHWRLPVSNSKRSAGTLLCASTSSCCSVPKLLLLHCTVSASASFPSPYIVISIAWTVKQLFLDCIQWVALVGCMQWLHFNMLQLLSYFVNVSLSL